MVRRCLDFADVLVSYLLVAAGEQVVAEHHNDNTHLQKKNRQSSEKFYSVIIHVVISN
jgi:hypothetical protein